MTTTEEQPREAMAAQIEALAPCPNPWCVPSEVLRPHLVWYGQSACIECGSCGMVGPDFSPVLMNEDGEQIGTQDAEAEAVSAWNTRPAIVTALRQAEAAPGVVEAWAAGRDAALAEVADMARLTPRMVHPMFIPAIEGVADTLHLNKPELLKALARQPTASPPIEVERTVADGALVGEAARLIDPMPFKHHRALYEYALHCGDTEADARKVADATHKPDCDRVLASAGAVLALASRQHAGVEGWQPIATAIDGERYVGAFRAPLRGDRWTIAGIGQVRDGMFHDHLGDWGAVDAIFRLPPVLLPAAPATDEGERT